MRLAPICVLRVGDVRHRRIGLRIRVKGPLIVGDGSCQAEVLAAADLAQRGLLLARRRGGGFELLAQPVELGLELANGRLFGF